MSTPWLIVFVICGVFACVLFLLESVLWMALRRKKVSVGRWRTLTRRILLGSVLLLGTGAGIWLLGPPLVRAASWLPILAGGFSALVATFHLAVVHYMVTQNPKR
jgi:hypothetical protein